MAPPSVFFETARYKFKKPIPGKARDRWGSIINETLDIIDTLEFFDEFFTIKKKDNEATKIKFDLTMIPPGTCILLKIPTHSGQLATLDEINIPSITDFTNAQHNHSSPSQGGKIDLSLAASGVLTLVHGGTGGSTALSARTNLEIRSKTEVFQISLPISNVFLLSFIPRVESLQVTLNGLVLAQGTSCDFTALGNQVTLLSVLNDNDLVTISYLH